MNFRTSELVLNKCSERLKKKKIQPILIPQIKTWTDFSIPKSTDSFSLGHFYLSRGDSG